MGVPLVKSGRFEAGTDLQCGENVVVEVDEEVRVGDRVVLGDNTYLSGRRVTIGNDFFGYSWGHPSNAWRGTQYELSRGWLEVGRGRRDEEDAVLTVGSRCTFHDNRIDLARCVTIGNDVGLSPEVAIYTHGYWMSPLDGFPCAYKPVLVGSRTIVGFRAVVLPGAKVGQDCVIGAGAVVSGVLPPRGVYGGVPARKIREVFEIPLELKRRLAVRLTSQYALTLVHRRLGGVAEVALDYPVFRFRGCAIDLETCTLEGEEDEFTDDSRDFFFKRGVRIYTRRPFRSLRALK